MKKLKLLYVVEAFGGGVFTYIESLANQLKEYFDILIAYGVREQTPDDIRSYFSDEVKLVRVKSFNRSINPLKDISAFHEVREIAKKFKPDVIHFHSSKAGVIGRFAFNGKRIPLFYTPHGYSFLMENHSQIKRIAYRWIEQISALRCCTTISCGKGEHKESLALTKNAVYVDNGIDVESLEKMLSAISEKNVGKKSVFTLGRICYQKNPELFNKIALHFPEIEFIWIGEGEMKDCLTAPNIKITGWLSKEQALQWASKSDIFILTSLWEGLPISLLEAMYMRKTCVVSDVIGNRDVIRNGRNGYVCSDEEAFVEAIKSALSNDNSQLHEEAVEDIMKHYNTKVMAEEYRKIYMAAIKKQS